MLKAQQKRLRRACRQLRGQQLQLLTMELAGVVAVTIHTVGETLTVPLHGDAAAQVANTLLEVLRERRQLLRREATVLQAELM
ncbi:hypothetical protein [Hymenobacter armeniacus]|uniref:YbaB/EbfC family DNA-binding protein n=1 Tax=Hymenobacter armeniacus TaxID=2771358 RepID=A0ABR8JTX5_9BACT|nr:hypothetical protein [Hymenobacter armeniacus]MBD2722208.1 hypothetical protein [Hymenobacter armeniacus]